MVFLSTLRFYHFGDKKGVFADVRSVFYTASPPKIGIHKPFEIFRGNHHFFKIIVLFMLKNKSSWCLIGIPFPYNPSSVD